MFFWKKGGVVCVAGLVGSMVFGVGCVTLEEKAAAPMTGFGVCFGVWCWCSLLESVRVGVFKGSVLFRDRERNV